MLSTLGRVDETGGQVDSILNALLRAKGRTADEPQIEFESALSLGDIAQQKWTPDYAAILPLDTSAQMHSRLRLRHNQVSTFVGQDQDLSVVFYDMTTIRTYGLTEEIDELRAYGMSKESTINRQVMLGVAQTADGIPLAHHVWPGNTAEVQTLQSAVADILKCFPIQRIIVVADRGLLSMDTL